jgi:hypothetical protein
MKQTVMARLARLRRDAPFVDGLCVAQPPSVVFAVFSAEGGGATYGQLQIPNNEQPFDKFKINGGRRGWREWESEVRHAKPGAVRARATPQDRLRSR